ncbi:UPF0481 protein At3g47200-like isoform X1 [Syzygium oleosum]|uniref:UPF0481 protein At3g47200-like isoform X1 n=1 Tax=Syzygium oleosum TaxID=219896 RepID=UPI0011D192BD|nr:UPF0481 protein At3g47200-like isoform X1 [Syzygium oleosum]
MAGGGNQDQITRETDCHVIGVPSKWSYSMEMRFKQWPTLLKPSASKRSCCIFRAPQSLLQINEKAYEPQIVSIGPYHHGQQRLNMVEQHKPRFFSTLLERTKNSGVGLDDYFNAIALRENDIRDCYSELLHCESSALVEMMVLDACFIVEVFRICGGVFEPDLDDPFFATPWMYIILIRDLLRIENQIPFFVLQEVFNLSNGNTENEANQRSLSELALLFFNIAAQRPEGQLEKFYTVSKAKHLLDLFRLSLVGHWDVEKGVNANDDCLELIPSARQLLRSGIKCKLRKGDNLNLLDINFNRGELQIPRLTLDDFMSFFLPNCIAFEQCYCYSSRHMTSYIIFMKCLVGTEADAELLSENQLLVNYLGSNAEVATFFNDLGKDIAFSIKISYLAELFRQVNRYHRSPCRMTWTGFKNKYFGSPWSFMSAIAAILLLGLTVLQAFYAVYGYYRPRK